MVLMKDAHVDVPFYLSTTDHFVNHSHNIKPSYHHYSTLTLQ